MVVEADDAVDDGVIINNVAEGFQEVETAEKVEVN